MRKIAGSGSIRQMHGSAEPYQKVTDPQHWFQPQIRIRIKCNAGKGFSYPIPVLRIRDVYPGFRIRIFSIPDPGYPIKEFKYFNLKEWFLNSRKYDLGCSTRIRILIFYPSRIQGSKRHRNTARYSIFRYR
jgi:hypothetical protein